MSVRIAFPVSINRLRVRRLAVLVPRVFTLPLLALHRMFVRRVQLDPIKAQWAPLRVSLVWRALGWARTRLVMSVCLVWRASTVQVLVRPFVQIARREVIRALALLQLAFCAAQGPFLSLRDRRVARAVREVQSLSLDQAVVRAV